MKKIYFFLLLLFIGFNGISQSMPSGTSTTNVTSTITYYDNGGTGNYTNGFTGQVTFVPRCGEYISVNFTSFATESGWDGLMIYNGPTTGSPLFSSGSTFNRGTCPNGAWSGTTSPGIKNSTSSDGTITIRFTSDGSTVNSGFVISVSSNIIQESNPLLTAPSACTAGSLSLGSGTYYDISLAANTYYNFSWANGSASTTGFTSTVIAGGTGATSSSFTTNQTSWYSGSVATTLRVKSTRAICTWSSTSGVLTYSHTPPTINKQPVSTSACIGETASFIAESNFSNPSYQWEYSSSATGPWTSLGAAATGHSHTQESALNVTASATFNGRYYHCAIKNGGCPAYSNAVRLTVGTIPSDITISPTSQTLCVGGNASITASTAVSSPRYRLVLTSAYGGAWHGIQEIRGKNEAGTYQTLTGINASSATYTDNPLTGAYNLTQAFDGIYNSGTGSGIQWLTPEQSNGTSPSGGTFPNSNWQNYGTYSPFYTPEWIEFTSTDLITVLDVYNGRYATGTPTSCYKDYYVLISYDNGTSWSTINQGVLSATPGLNSISIEPTYTWKKGATTVGTGKTLTLNSITVAQGGAYNLELNYGCNTKSLSATITVTPNNTATTPSTPTVCANTAMSAIILTTTGATGIGTAIGLPTGVTAAWASNKITISGTPIAAGTFNYSIPMTGGCGTVNATGTIIVNAVSTAPLETTITPAGTCGGTNVILKVNDEASKGGEIDRSGWTVGTGGTTGFAQNGITTENGRINGTDPFGNSAVVWEAHNTDATSNDDGGWNSSNFAIDNTKLYRYSVWVNRKVMGADGRFYFGCHGYGAANGVVNLSTAAVDGNPYFWYSNSPAVELPVDEWVLVVGYIFPNNYTGAALNPESGLYKISSGKIANTYTDFKWLPSTTSANFRTYLYYCTDATVKQQWVYPRVDIVDGSEPTIQNLLNGFDINGGLSANASWKWHTSTCAGAAAGTGNSITVTPAATTRYFVRAEGGDCPLTTTCKEATVTVNPPVANPTITAVGATTYCNTGTVELTASDVNLAKNALSFTGGQYVNMANPPELQISKDQTIEMWLKPSAFSGRLNPYDKAYAGEGTITQEINGTLNYFYGNLGTNGGLGGTNYQGFNTGTALTVGQWNHIALVRDLTNMTLNWYINGVLTNSSPATFTVAVVGANPVQIGVGYAGGYEGEIDELRVWNIARSQAAIQADMNQPIQAGTTGLAGYWRFDETSGTVVLDASGNSNTGTFGAPAPTRVIPSTAPMTPLYSWTPSTALDVTSGKVVNASPTATTTYTVTLANPLGCVDGTKSQLIKVDIQSTLPTSITVDNSNINNCHGREVTLTEVGGTLQGTAKYKWGTASGGTQVSTGTTGTTVTHTPTATTNYYVGVTANGTCPAQSNTTPLMYILPTKLGALSGNEAATCYVSGTNPIHFYSASKKYIGSVNPNGRTGTLTMTSYTGTGGTMFACDAPTNPKFKTAYMGRNFTVIPTGAISGAGSLSVYFPFTGTELTNLQTASTTDTPGNTKDDVTAITDLVMTQHSGPTEDGDPFNNCADGSSIVVTLTASGALNTAFTLSPAVTANYGQIDISSFSEFYFQGLNNNSPLPVTLTSFTANCDNQVTLTWSTASEQNSDKFIVEKSRDGQNWLAVGEQSAAGNSNTMITYNETDENPLNGINYYRLRQTDLNGVEQIYGPISTTCSGNENNSMTVYPNPNNGAFTVEISSIENHTGAQLLLTDMTGRTVVSQIVNITAGTNQIMISNGDLQMGTYMVTVRGIDSELKPVKVVVNR